MPKNPFSNWTIQQVEAFNAKTVTGRLSSELAKEKIYGGQGDKGLHAPSRKILVTRQGLTPDAPKKKRKPAYTPEQVIEWCKQHGLPEPVFEYKFHPTRKWRIDIFFNPKAGVGVALEVCGGLWVFGGHSRGMAQKRDWEKWMEAQRMGWKMAWCEPKDLLTKQTADIIRGLLNS